MLGIGLEDVGAVLAFVGVGVVAGAFVAATAARRERRAIIDALDDHLEGRGPETFAEEFGRKMTARLGDTAIPAALVDACVRETAQDVRAGYVAGIVVAQDLIENRNGGPADPLDDEARS